MPVKVSAPEVRIGTWGSFTWISEEPYETVRFVDLANTLFINNGSECFAMKRGPISG